MYLAVYIHTSATSYIVHRVSFLSLAGDTPSPQVGSPKADSDMNDSPQQPMVTEEEEEEGEGEKEGEKTGDEVKEKPEAEGDDPCTRSEGVVRFVLSDPSNMESQLSNPIVIRNVPWYVYTL